MDIQLLATRAHRVWRQQKIWLLGILLVLIVTAVSVAKFTSLKLDRRSAIVRTEEPWTYLSFGIASVMGLVFSILILMNQKRGEFGDSQELLSQLIEIIDDAAVHNSRLSLLYPSPNPGQWDSLFRGHKAFSRLRKRLLEPTGMDAHICMLSGDALDEKTALGQFVRRFHDATFVKGERIPATEEAPVDTYRKAAALFFNELREAIPDIRHIHDSWAGEITQNQLLILAAGHTLGFVGYMTLEGEQYRFKALPFTGSAGFLHGLFDALASFYSQPMTRMTTARATVATQPATNAGDVNAVTDVALDKPEAPQPSVNDHS